MIDPLYNCTELPWPELKIPKYKPYDKGGVKLEQVRIPFLRGYFRGLQTVGESYTLRKDDKVWMSITPMELESHAPHLAMCKGHTVIVGAGMGLILYNALLKPEVTKVTVIESDPRVIKFLRKMGMQNWPNFDKVTIIKADIFDAPDIKEPVDFLYVDIWPTLGTEEAFADTKVICEWVDPKNVGFWGQELDFIHFLNARNSQPPPTIRDLLLWSLSSPIPLIGPQFENYHFWCMAAAVNVSLY